ncbi:MAG TPA: ATP-dependent RNA helicase HrpA, partial [Streptosporangiaceae bacterium]|nr:ATP-dependent RNA helicase HrpA [Streptosporangiaceae bacterium]
RARLPELTQRDQLRLRRRADKAAGLQNEAQRLRAFRQLRAELDRAEAVVARRRAAVPVISYPPELPISQKKDEIAAALRDHQVIVVAGETGSGKTTQLPKICLELGRGITGQIGHTQPRRIAARTVAARIAEELGTELGSAVGFQVRFTDQSSDETLVKVMTDGILLTEMQRDRRLLRYDTLIIDEAHERSLNIDFILGYLKRLLPTRPDLKVIITSATIDPQRFSEAFGGAPVVEVSGRTYPVEVRYEPVTDPDEPGEEPRDQAQAIGDAVQELTRSGPGDILVFLSGEREIRDTADALSDRFGGDAQSGGLEILPLYARLSTAEQYRVFQAHRGRRVVLATNVAETSLTVPGIKYVIDPGTARISRYSYRTKVQRLPIEPISQASANQRKGRCGRTSDGICIRLYSEEDFLSRPEFTDPEILRTNLASVILRMAALDLGEMADFPFVDPPDERNVTDGVRLLEELGAYTPDRPRDHGRRLSEVGRQLSDLPVDPRIGRMIIEAGRNGCVREVLVIASALSMQDVRERPADSREEADAQHARFAEPGSDFLAYLHLWDYLREQQRALSSSAFRRMCRREYLHYLRVREWQDLYGQLRSAAGDLGLTTGPGRDGERDENGRIPIPAGLAQQVHLSLLAGLLSHIGMRDTDPKAPARGKRRPLIEFAGARNARFALFPDSALARKPPPWVIVTELVETSRLWGRTAAQIQPEWAESLAGHLVKRTYSEPEWDSRRGAVMALERVTLYGLPIVTGRRVGYARVDPKGARELFIRHALVEGDWTTRHHFFQQNQELLDRGEELERRARRRGLVVDDEALYDFYDRRIPAQVTSARHFDSWWKKTRQQTPELLTFSPDLITGPGADRIQPSDYPDRWDGFPLSYEFTPGDTRDGVTVDVPLAQLNQVQPEPFAWHVPGLRAELVTELIRTLPKQLRVNFVPAPDVAREALAGLGPAHGDLLSALSRELTRLRGVQVPRDAWDPAKLPAHLRVTFRVTDGQKVLAEGKDLDELKRQVRPRLRATLAEAAHGLARTGLRRWDLGTLPREFSNGQVKAYPALADAGEAVDVRLFDTAAAAERSMRRGTRRLLLLQVPSGARSIGQNLSTTQKLALSRSPYPGAVALLDDCAAAAADEIIARAGGPAWDADGFAALVAAARAGLHALTARVVDDVARILGEAHEVEAVLAQAAAHAGEPAFADVRAQFDGLIHPGFISATGARRLPDLVRYLRAIQQRLDKIGDGVRDAERMATVHRVAQAYRETVQDLPPGRRDDPDVQAVRWMIEELRVSLFAQTLGTPGPVSEKRIHTALDRL